MYETGAYMFKNVCLYLIFVLLSQIFLNFFTIVLILVISLIRNCIKDCYSLL